MKKVWGGDGKRVRLIGIWSLLDKVGLLAFLQFNNKTDNIGLHTGLLFADMKRKKDGKYK